MGKGEETRAAILDRAIALGSELGLEGLSIGRLAEELRLSKSGLFAHFQSKEALQVETLERASQRFVEVVVKPALAAPRGEPRVRAFFDRWLQWPRLVPQPGGCLFVAAASELDDRPGAARDRLAQLQRDWRATLARAAAIAKEERHFRAEVDPDQFAFEEHGIMLECQFSSRLLRDGKANERARDAFERLIVSSRTRR
jgi:AcrR family transcriptional regulator